MATKEAKEPTKTEQQFVTHSGAVIESKVIKGKDHKLTAQQQGQKARGELDENLEVIPGKEPAGEKLNLTAGSAAANAALTDKEKARDKQIEERNKYLEESGEGRKTVKVSEPLYHGKISAEAIAAATGEKVSVVWEQAQPTTEDGLFHSFLAYHPSAKRDTFKIDTDNEIDPTLRTYLEKP